MKFWPFTTLLPLILTACTSGPIVKAQLDEEVNRLCAIDGGIKVYETVKLPPEKFNKWSQVNFDVPREERKKFESEYYYTHTILYYRKGNPELYRSHFKLFKSHDNVLLGETITYGRRGGDMVGPWHESYYRCPPSADISNLKQSVFVPSAGE
jgi:hypothetical protein